MHLFLANMIVYIYDSLYTQNSTYDKLTTYSSAILRTLSKTGSMYQAYLSIRTIGFGILTVYFIIALGTKLEGRNTSPSIIFQTLLQYFIGYAMALFSFDIVTWMFKLGDAMAASILESTNVGTGLNGFTTVLANSIKDDIGFTGQVMYIIKGLLPWLGCFAADFVITYAIVTRVLRICVNAVLSPIAVANFFDDSRHADGVRFLKRTFAMCLQCSAIMVITAAVAGLSGYFASNTIYGTSMQSESLVETAKNSMLDSATSDYAAVSDDVSLAVDKIGRSAYTSDSKLKERYATAREKLSKNIDKVTSSKETEYKKYERDLGIEIFSRDGSSYVYNSDGYAILKEKYLTFSSDSLVTFLLAVLGGKGSGYWTFLLLLIVKVGLIKQSNSLCNVIVGL